MKGVKEDRGRGRARERQGPRGRVVGRKTEREMMGARGRGWQWRPLQARSWSEKRRKMSQTHQREEVHAIHILLSNNSSIKASWSVVAFVPPALPSFPTHHHGILCLTLGVVSPPSFCTLQFQNGSL